MPLDTVSLAAAGGGPRQVAIVPPPNLEATTPEEQFFKQIIQPVYDDALNLAEKLVGKHAAGDAVHQALLEMWNSLDKLQPEQQNTNYFLAVVRNKAVSERRRARRLVEITDDIPDENAVTDLPDLPLFSAATKLAEEIDKMIYTMSPIRLEVFLLVKVGQRSHKEVADLLGISGRTVSKHIELAMRHIDKGLATMGISISDGSIRQLLLRSSETTNE
jgi:RNA polymerase sigma-70 factor, ECF subfamily